MKLSCTIDTGLRNYGLTDRGNAQARRQRLFSGGAQLERSEASKTSEVSHLQLTAPPGGYPENS